MNKSLLVPVITVIFVLFCCNASDGKKQNNIGKLSIGWASADLTPNDPVIIRSSISTGIKDPVTATALALEYDNGSSSERVIMISCDLISIPDGRRSSDNLLGEVRNRKSESIPEIDSNQVILNVSHTHYSPTVAI